MSAPVDTSAGDERPVLFERRSGIGIVTLNRPAARNAINVAAARAIVSYLAEIESDPAIRVGVLTSSTPQAFCAGADLRDIAAGRGPELVTRDGGLAGFVRKTRKKPWIAAASGFAVGGGFRTFLLACDMIVAGESLAVALPETGRGMIAGAGGAIRLPRLLPRAVAAEMLLTGRRLDAAQALSFGLVNCVVADRMVLATALELAAKVVAAAPLAAAESLALVQAAHDGGEADLWALSAAATARIVASDDAREGAAAFIASRPPKWTGR